MTIEAKVVGVESCQAWTVADPLGNCLAVRGTSDVSKPVKIFSPAIVCAVAEAVIVPLAVAEAEGMQIVVVLEPTDVFTLGVKPHVPSPITMRWALPAPLIEVIPVLVTVIAPPEGEMEMPPPAVSVAHSIPLFEVFVLRILFAPAKARPVMEVDPL